MQSDISAKLCVRCDTRVTVTIFKNSRCTARNLEDPFAPYDLCDHYRSYTTDRRHQNCSGPIQAELWSGPVCNPASAASWGPSAVSVVAPVAEVVAVGAVWAAVRQYCAQVALCWGLKHNSPLGVWF